MFKKVQDRKCVTEKCGIRQSTSKLKLSASTLSSDESKSHSRPYLRSYSRTFTAINCW